MAAHVTSGADEPLFVQRVFSVTCAAARSGVGSEGCHEAIGLFLERGVATDAILMFLRRVRGHIGQLSQDARPHGVTVQASLPVVELGGMARTAGARVERGLDRAEVGGRGSLRAKWPGPVFPQKDLDLIDLLNFPLPFGVPRPVGPS